MIHHGIINIPYLLEEDIVGKRRKDEPAPTPTILFNVRAPERILIALGKMADAKRVSRNQIIITLLERGTKKFREDPQT